MSSPFPGMDPYLETTWGDVHTSLVTYARDQLRRQLPPDLKVRVEEHVAVELEEEPGHGFYPDVRIIEWAPEAQEQAKSGADVALSEPLIVPREIESETQRWLVIIDSRSGNRVVTTIEILSPSNKSNEAGRQAYRRKQRDLLDAGVNLVEIDLLREGRFVLAVPPHCVPQPYLAPYRICVVRGAYPDRAEVYRVSLRKPLPTIRIPLRQGEADAHLDLQAIVDAAYENGGYEDIDYRLDPTPPLQGEDAVWADAILREKGRR